MMDVAWVGDDYFVPFYISVVMMVYAMCWWYLWFDLADYKDDVYLLCIDGQGAYELRLSLSILGQFFS